MAMIYSVQGLDDTAYAALKADAKHTLSFPVRIRRHTERYAYHHIDIRATAATKHRLTDTQITELLEWCAARNLDTNLHVVAHRHQWDVSCFRDGVNYLAQHTAITA